MVIADTPTYTAFMDDSGAKEYIDDYDAASIRNPECLDRGFWERNYFVLAAVIAPNSALPLINRRMVELKRLTFGTPAVEVKSDWLRNPHQRRKRYLVPYGVEDRSLDAFGISVTRVFEEFREDLTLIACVFDKRYYRHREEHDPYCSACQVILERVQFTMQGASAACVMVVDQMESELDVTRGRHGELVDVYLNRRPMKHVFVTTFTRVKDVRFRRSSDENLIQLADLAAYNVYRQFVDHGREWEDTSRQQVSYYPYFELLMGNLAQYNGKAVGCGLCKLPDPKRIKWF
jgi:hypothetical protein